MWIGEVPDEISTLTLPERMLIARYYSAAYIVKLYPKNRGAQSWDPATLNQGLRGNVSSYRLNTQDIVSMVDGRFLPPHPSILLATIGVTFVGPQNVPDRCMPPMLMVNRSRIKTALQFLQRANPLYWNVIISEENLHLLPEHGVPDEIMAVVQHSDDMDILEQEHSGYTDLDDMGDGGGNDSSNEGNIKFLIIVQQLR
ncbi:hypothetical protein JVU11DRAFT_9247 [Chiua virens]|nr:hypothetical protein JVU11DRAFT_9247 [Chiua virens]